MRLSAIGLQHLKSVEGFSKRAYWDRGHYSIGYGHNGPDVKANDVISMKRAEELLISDIQWVMECIKRHVRVPVSGFQHDALVSFIYNIGCPQFRTSGVLRALNKGQHDLVPSKLLEWNIPRSILGRRRKEAALWQNRRT